MTMKRFYTFGMWCFVVIGTANLWGLVLKIKDALPLWALIASGGGVALNFGFAWFFAWLSNQELGPPQGKTLESFDFSEVPKLMKDAKRGNKK